MKKLMYLFAVLLLIISALADAYKYSFVGNDYLIIDVLDKIGFISACFIISDVHPTPPILWMAARVTLVILFWGLIVVIGRIFIFQNLPIPN